MTALDTRQNTRSGTEEQTQIREQATRDAKRDAQEAVRQAAQSGTSADRSAGQNYEHSKQVATEAAAGRLSGQELDKIYDELFRRAEGASAHPAERVTQNGRMSVNTQSQGPGQSLASKALASDWEEQQYLRTSGTQPERSVEGLEGPRESIAPAHKIATGFDEPELAAKASRSQAVPQVNPQAAFNPDWSRANLRDTQMFPEPSPAQDRDTLARQVRPDESMEPWQRIHLN